MISIPSPSIKRKQKFALFGKRFVLCPFNLACGTFSNTCSIKYYDGDQCRGWVAVEADAVEELGMVGALRRGRFYATMGPEVHLERISPTTVKLTCSPAVKIAFLSNAVWTSGRMVRGDGLTEATYELKRHETYIRAEVTDAEGRVGFSHIISL